MARHTAAWVRGAQEVGIAACAKHFPGHGATSTDSHHTRPIVDHMPSPGAAMSTYQPQFEKSARWFAVFVAATASTLSHAAG